MTTGAVALAAALSAAAIAGCGGDDDEAVRDTPSAAANAPGIIEQACRPASGPLGHGRFAGLPGYPPGR